MDMIIDSVLGLLSMGQPLASFELELPGSVFLVPSSSGQAKGRVPHCLHLSCAFRHLTQGKRHLSLPKMSVFLTSLSGGVTSLDQDVPFNGFNTMGFAANTKHVQIFGVVDIVVKAAANDQGFQALNLGLVIICQQGIVHKVHKDRNLLC